MPYLGQYHLYMMIPCYNTQEAIARIAVRTFLSVAQTVDRMIYNQEYFHCTMSILPACKVIVTQQEQCLE